MNERDPWLIRGFGNIQNKQEVFDNVWTTNRYLEAMDVVYGDNETMKRANKETLESWGLTAEDVINWYKSLDNPQRD